MRFLEKPFARSPPAVRVAPFVIFLALTFCQGRFGAASACWFYLGKTLAGAWLIREMRPFVSEMRWAVSWEAVAVGVGIFVVWVGVSGDWTTQNSLWSKLGLVHAPLTPPWNPNGLFGRGSALAGMFIAARLLGSTLVVPPLEEVFYRSFLYRYAARQDFLSVPLNRFLPGPFWVTALIFGFSHNEWLAGVLCGAAFQWLVLRKNRLGDAMTAHAVTNFLLGIWVVWRGAWQFWG
ncbi:MAG: CAAX prenyl protease-related protein [Verrucomicrobiota bacterium]|nr:CAAX prenyl protease-related protein [Verrucomicrobiota bacterium]